MDTLDDVRGRLPCFSHRRDEVYALAGIRMIPAHASLDAMNSTFVPLSIEEEKTPYFVFEKYPVPKSSTFLESPLSIAFTNISCVVPGRRCHWNIVLSFSYNLDFSPSDVLVATRRCVSRLKDLTAEEIVDFFLTVSKCQRMLELRYQTPSSTVTVQDGEFAGQTVKVIQNSSFNSNSINAKSSTCHFPSIINYQNPVLFNANSTSTVI